MRKRLFKLLALALSLVIGVVIAEQVLRVLGYEYQPLRVSATDGDAARYYHLFEDDQFVYDSELIWKPRAGVGVFNAEGFRGPIMGTETPSGALRLVTIGDSNTLGWAGEDGANWPRDLQAFLSDLDVPLEVINAGVWGYTSYQGVRRMEEVLDYEPDVVLVSFGSNDALRVRQPDNRFAGRSNLYRAVERRLTHYRLGQLLIAAVRRDDAESETLDPRVEIEEYRRNLHAMAELCRRHGARMVLLTRPFEQPIVSELSWKNFADEYNLATLEVGREAGIPTIDLYTRFKGKLELFADESHFNEAGHELAARFIGLELVPLLDAIKNRAE